MTEPAIIEAPLVLTLKCSDDRDAPWLVMRASNLQQLESMLHELEASSVSVDIGRVAAMFQTKAAIGARLGATPLDPAVDGGSFDNVTAAPSTGEVFEKLGGQVATPADATPAATTSPAAAPTKFPKFGAAKPAATPAATPPPVTTSRPPAEAPPAAKATGGFPAAPAWKKK